MKTIKLNLALFVTTALGLAVACADDTTASTPTLPPASTKTGVTFATDIKPIFDASCVKCHTSTGTRPPAAKLALDSLTVAHIGDDSDGFMPKGKNAKQLTPDQIGLIRAWIDQGAK